MSEMNKFYWTDLTYDRLSGYACMIIYAVLHVKEENYYGMACQKELAIMEKP